VCLRSGGCMSKLMVIVVAPGGCSETEKFAWQPRPGESL
jgi:hypothetical protein